MRIGRGGYSSRGGTGRGTGYRPSGSYGSSRMHSTGRPGGRYGDSHHYNGGAAGGSTRYQSSYSSGGAPATSGSHHYDSRKYDKFNSNSSSARHDSGPHKRSYHDTSRDRAVDDRKRSRTDSFI